MVMKLKSAGSLLFAASLGLMLPGCTSSPDPEPDCGPACNGVNTNLHRNFHGYSTCWRSWPEEFTACPSDALLKLEQQLGHPESIPTPIAVPEFVPQPKVAPDSLPTPSVVPEDLPKMTVVPESLPKITVVPESLPKPKVVPASSETTRPVQEKELQSLPALPTVNKPAPNQGPSPRSGSVAGVIKASFDANDTASPRVTATPQPTPLLLKSEQEPGQPKVIPSPTIVPVVPDSLPVPSIVPESSPKAAIAPESKGQLSNVQEKERQPLLAPTPMYKPAPDQKPSPRSGSLIRIIETPPASKVISLPEIPPTSQPMVR